MLFAFLTLMLAAPVAAVTPAAAAVAPEASVQRADLGPLTRDCHLRCDVDYAVCCADPNQTCAYFCLSELIVCHGRCRLASVTGGGAVALLDESLAGNGEVGPEGGREDAPSCALSVAPTAGATD